MPADDESKEQDREMIRVQSTHTSLRDDGNASVASHESAPSVGSPNRNNHQADVEATRQNILLTFVDPQLEARYVKWVFCNSANFGGKLFTLLIYVVSTFIFLWYHGGMMPSQSNLTNWYMLPMIVHLAPAVLVGIIAFWPRLREWREFAAVYALTWHWPAWILMALWGKDPSNYSYNFIILCNMVCGFTLQPRFSRFVVVLVLLPVVLTICYTLPWSTYWTNHRYEEIVLWPLMALTPALFYVVEAAQRTNFLSIDRNLREARRMDRSVTSLQNLIVSAFLRDAAVAMMDPEMGASITRDRGMLHPEVAMIVTDLAGFTAWTAVTPQLEVVQKLGDIYLDMDRAASRWRVQKVTTVGDSYVGIVPTVAEPAPFSVIDAISFSRDSIRDLQTRMGDRIAMRIGIHFGEAVGFFTGSRPLQYDIMGADVDHAKVMEQEGVPSRIHVSHSAANTVKGYGTFVEPVASDWGLVCDGFEQHAGVSRATQPLEPLSGNLAIGLSFVIFELGRAAKKAQQATLRAMKKLPQEIAAAAAIRQASISVPSSDQAFQRPRSSVVAFAEADAGNSGDAAQATPASLSASQSLTVPMSRSAKRRSSATPFGSGRRSSSVTNTPDLLPRAMSISEADESINDSFALPDSAADSQPGEGYMALEWFKFGDDTDSFDTASQPAEQFEGGALIVEDGAISQSRADGDAEASPLLLLDQLAVNTRSKELAIEAREVAREERRVVHEKDWVGIAKFNPFTLMWYEDEDSDGFIKFVMDSPVLLQVQLVICSWIVLVFIAQVVLCCFDNERNRLIAGLEAAVGLPFALLKPRFVIRNVYIDRALCFLVPHLIATAASFLDISCTSDGEEAFYTGIVVMLFYQVAMMYGQFQLILAFPWRLAMNFFTVGWYFAMTAARKHVYGDDGVLEYDPVIFVVLAGAGCGSYFFDYVMHTSYVSLESVRHLKDSTHVRFSKINKAALQLLLPSFALKKLEARLTAGIEAEAVNINLLDANASPAPEEAGAASGDQPATTIEDALHEPILWHFPNAAAMFVSPKVDHLSSDMDLATQLRIIDQAICVAEDAARRRNIIKVKSIGTTLLFVASPEIGCDDPLRACAETALLIRRELKRALKIGNVSIGIHASAMFGAIMGNHNLRFDVFGDTVNLASRLCYAKAFPNKVLVTAECGKALMATSQQDHKQTITAKPCGTVYLKGKGDIDVWAVGTDDN